MLKKWGFAGAALCVLLTACSDGGGSADGPADQPDGKKTVVVSVSKTNAFLDQAAAKFEEQHPDIHIEIKEYMASPKQEGGMMAAVSAADIEKYIQTVTTEILSGKAGDLISMWDLPQSKFVEKKAFDNLYDWMDKDGEFQKGSYYQNVFKSSQVGDGLYGVPISFTPHYVKGNKPLIEKAGISVDDQKWTWDQINEVGKQVKEKLGPDYYPFANMFPNTTVAEYVSSNYAQLVQGGKANFDTDAFRDVLRQIKALFDESTLKAEYTTDNAGKALFATGSFFSPAASVADVLNPDSVYMQKPTFDGKSAGIPFGPGTTLGLNSKSKVKQEAWEFLKFMLSDDMQASPDLIGFPVNKAVTERMMEAAREKIAGGGKAKDDAAGKPISGEYKYDNTEIPPIRYQLPDAKTIDERLAFLKSYLEKASVSSNADFKVIDIAMKESEAFMNGQKSAEEVSKLIQNRVTTYLNE